MLRFIIVGILCLLVVVYGQNCNQEFDKFRDCVKQKRQEQQNASAKDREGDQNKRKEEIKQCFTKNQCKEPSFDNPSGKGEHKGGHGKGEGGDKRHQCMKQIEDKARPIVEKCVQAKQPDFHFPSTEKDHHGGEKQGKGGHLGNIGKTINESCPTEVSRQNTKKCLHDSMQKDGSSGDRRQQAQARFSQTCQNRATCFNGMSAECQTKFNESKKIVCDCVQDLMKTSKSQYEQEYNTCVGESGTAQQGSGKGQNGHQKGSGVDSMVKKMCNTKDYCQQGFKSKGQGKNGGGDHGGSGKGKHRQVHKQNIQ